MNGGKANVSEREGAWNILNESENQLTGGRVAAPRVRMGGVTSVG